MKEVTVVIKTSISDGFPTFVECFENPKDAEIKFAELVREEGITTDQTFIDALLDDGYCETPHCIITVQRSDFKEDQEYRGSKQQKKIEFIDNYVRG